MKLYNYGDMIIKSLTMYVIGNSFEDTLDTLWSPKNNIVKRPIKDPSRKGPPLYKIH